MNYWKPVFINFLRKIPGRDGVPLSYVIRKNVEPEETPQVDFLEEYVQQAPLTGETFHIDSKEVRTYIVKYITGNEDAEAKVQSLQDDNCGRAAFMSLMEVYEGTGINSKAITLADKIINELQYTD